MKIVAVVTKEARLVRKYERARFSPLDMALLARRFAPRLAPPTTDNLLLIAPLRYAPLIAVR